MRTHRGFAPIGGITSCILAALATAVGHAAPVKLTVAFWGAASEYTDIWVPIKTDFEKVHPGIELELMHVPTGIQDKMISMAIGGQPADVWMSNADTAIAYAQAGIIHDLRPFMQADRSFQAGNFFPAALDAYALEGLQAGIPSHFQVTSVWYNKDLFDTAGLGYPKANWTWSDFAAIAKRLTRDANSDGQPEQWGLVMPFSGEFLLPWLYSAGGGVVDDSSRPTRAAIGDPPSIQALSFLRRLAAEDRVIEPGFGNANPFYEGRVGMYPYYAIAQRMASFAKFPYNVARLPAGPAGAINAVVPGGFVMGRGKHTAEAWALIKFIAQKGAFSYNTVPAYLPIARSNTWPFVEVPEDYDRAAFVEGALSARTHAIKTPKVAEIYSALSSLQPALKGEESIGTAAANVARQIDALLKEAPSR